MTVTTVSPEVVEALKVIDEGLFYSTTNEVVSNGIAVNALLDVRNAVEFSKAAIEAVDAALKDLGPAAVKGTWLSTNLAAIRVLVAG